MSNTKTTQESELEIKPSGCHETILIKGNLAGLHDNPQKIHQLLDLLELPKGTEVTVTTRAASVIVR
jgi:hypothetical protein